jgi:hypothetical protein
MKKKQSYKASIGHSLYTALPSLSPIYVKLSGSSQFTARNIAENGRCTRRRCILIARVIQSGHDAANTLAMKQNRLGDATNRTHDS